MNTQKEKQNLKRHKKNMRRRTLLASQNVLFIDEVAKMLYPIGFDDFSLEAEPPVMNLDKFTLEPNAKEVA